IPAYRLPRDVLDAEVRRVVALGVDVATGTRVVDVEAERAASGADAVFLAVGAQLGKRVEIPAGDSGRVVDAVTFLHAVAAGEPVSVGRRVAVYGGGDTALDAARTAKRLGATDAVIVYRRTRDRMPAHDEELAQAIDEGVTVRWLSTIDRYEGDRLIVETMRLNAEGFPEPTGEFEELGADALVLALGQDADLSLIHEQAGVVVRDGVVEVASSMMTGAPGVFAGGDVTPDDRTATVAVGHGARAARGIDAYLTRADPDVAPARDVATFERLNTWYYADAPRTVRPELERVRRQSGFDEVVGALTEENALFEARRCMSCGNCFECDNCFGVCPDNAVIKHADGTYEFDYDFCKGCGVCVAECPCGAIEMVPEQI
ncbi:MAG: FAD-dependent oxidoreductase, partial [Acidimicrobiales bacterium]